MSISEYAPILVDHGSIHLSEIPFLQQITATIPVDELTAECFQRRNLLILSGGGDSIITSGGIRDRFKPEIGLLEKAETPVIGICLGMEAIAAANGIWLTRLANRHEGVDKVKVTNRSPMRDFVKVHDSFNAFFAHRWAVKTKDLPPQFIPLATLSINGEEYVAMMRHAAKPIYAFQFHPEVLRNNNVVRLWKNLIADIYNQNTNSRYADLTTMNKLGVLAREMAHYQTVKAGGIMHPQKLNCAQSDMIIDCILKEGGNLGAHEYDYAIAWDNIHIHHTGCQTHTWLDNFVGAAALEKDNDLVRFIANGHRLVE